MGFKRLFLSARAPLPTFSPFSPFSPFFTALHITDFLTLKLQNLKPGVEGDLKKIEKRFSDLQNASLVSNISTDFGVRILHLTRSHSSAQHGKTRRFFGCIEPHSLLEKKMFRLFRVK
jgi:hypothetical protein